MIESQLKVVHTREQLAVAGRLDGSFVRDERERFDNGLVPYQPLPCSDAWKLFTENSEIIGAEVVSAAQSDSVCDGDVQPADICSAIAVVNLYYHPHHLPWHVTIFLKVHIDAA